MKIGYACTPIVVPWKTTRRFPLKNLNPDIFLSCVKENLSDLLKILEYNVSNNIYLFRISSDIIPFGSHPSLTIPWTEIFKDDLIKIGEFIKSNDIRVSMHPGQYTVLNSPNNDVVNKAILDLEYHNNFLNSLNIDFSHKIILHIGGVYNNKEVSTNNFIKNFDKLSSSLQRRLIVENDERSYCLDDVLFISKECKIPTVYDNLHENCYFKKDISPYNSLSKVYPSWENDNTLTKVHYSQQDLNKKIGSHSQYLFTENFIQYLIDTKDFDFDIMLEVKDKDVSAIKAINILKELDTPITDNNKTFIFNCYKHLLLSYSENDLKKASDILFNHSTIQFYKYIDNLLLLSQKPSNYKSTLKNIFLTLNNSLNSKEISHFNKLLKNDKLINAKEYLLKCERKYSNNPIYNFFYYYEIGCN
ncbi:MAG: UV DNA damage repair endonuclease UvsE [Clostridium sp.]